MIKHIVTIGTVLFCLLTQSFAQQSDVLTSPTPLQSPAETIQSDKPGISVKPGINDKFLDAKLNVTEWVERFETESREVFASRHEIFKALHIKPGDQIADIGTGTGLFVEPFALQAGETGWVYAIDIAPGFVQRVRELSEAKTLTNVTPVLGGEKDIHLAPGTLTKAFLCDVYHHFEYPQQSLASIHRALKPGGELVVIDFERIPGISREWTLGHVRAGKSEFKQEILNAGFEFVEEVQINGFKENYFLRFRRS